MNSLQNAPSHIFENVARLLNLLGDLFVNREVINTFQQFIPLCCIANFNIHSQVDIIAVTNHLFEVVAAVRSTKLHLFEFYCSPHIRTDIFEL